MYRRILGYLLVIFLYFIYAFQSHAVSINFTKDAVNPLSTNFSLLQSTITKDIDGYKMWFTGHNGTNFKIGYSSSPSGGIWPSSTFVSVSDTGDNHDPSLFVQNGNRFIYYISEPSEGSGVDIKIKRAIANGSVFSSPQQINLARQSWNSSKLSCPYVYAEGSNYFLFSCGTNGTSWSLGLAISTDGVNFTPCTNNPIVNGNTPGNSQVYVDETGIKHLLFHSDLGIEEVTTTGALGCNSNWTDRRTVIPKDKPYDQSQIISPSFVDTPSSKELFYVARGPATSETWRLSRANVQEIANNKPKIVIVPGFFASWNQDAVLYNRPVNLSSWKIPNYIEEYKGLTKTLDNLGFVLNKDYYVFPYDWRKPINASSDDLRNFLQTKIWNTDQSAQVQLVGHSMGGIVSRIYAQKYPNDNVIKVVTAGSPHRGVVQVYQPLEAGETQKDNTFLWLGTKLLINLNRQSFRSDRATVQTIIPSLYDLFPTFDFLKNRNGSFKPLNSLSIKNSLLNTYANLGALQNKLTVIYGNKSSTSSPVAFEISGRSLIDKLTGDYIDGRPVRLFSGPGDYLVPTISSLIGTSNQELPLDHGEIVYSKTAIKRILDALSISYDDSKVVQGNATQISTSMIVAIQSPVEASVQVGSKTYYAQDGIIFIPNAESGTYTLNVKKLAPGDYTITMAQIAEQNDVWEQFAGTIESRNLDEVDSYVIKYNKTRATPQITTNCCSKYQRTPFFFRKKLACKVRRLMVR